MAAISAAFVDRMETTPKATDIYSFDKNTSIRVVYTNRFSTEGQIKMVHYIFM